MKKILYIVLVISCSFLLTACGKASGACSKSGIYFDTMIQITLYDAAQEKYLEHCLTMAQEYESLFSPSVEGSDIWRINHAKGETVEISPETFLLLKEALSYSDVSGGRIDPTTLPLSGLWGFYVENGADTAAKEQVSQHVPAKEEIASCLSHVDYRKLHLTEKEGVCYACLEDAQAKIDLGFIAKGYIADKMKEYLLSQGVESGIINLGGNVLTIGAKPDGSDYTIGIRQETGNDTPAMKLPVRNQSVVTSGIYERCFTENGVSYHHVLDALTGYPADNELYSVTILSDSSLQGDALSTTCLLLGTEDGMALIEETKDVEAIFLTKDGEIIKSSGMD